MYVEPGTVAIDPTLGRFAFTGGGWFTSPPGAFRVNPDLTGKATFGFVSRYKKGATVPTGNTEFQFHAADLNFHSSIYEWLVIAGVKAQFKGVGEINGQGGYKFMLTAFDSDINTNDVFEIDRFRIRIWWQGDDVEHVVYDNGLGADGDDDMAATEIAGGSIKIHKR